MKKILLLVLFGMVAMQLGAEDSVASASTVSAEEALFTTNNLWIMISGMLVFMMHLGFATVESGLARAKNCTNILFKNTMVPPIGLLTFAICGFSLMYPGESNWVIGKFLGFAGFGLHAPEGNPMDYNGLYTYWTDYFFQGMFAATAATIVSGAVAGRVKLNAFMIFTLIYVAIVYPIIGSWGWGGGFLADMGFHDFAGSTFVHSVGGWGALAGVMLLGPRIGKYVNGISQPIAGHSMPLATIGVFLLWFGWFGFNGGSVFSAEPTQVSYVLTTTSLGASAGIVCAMFMGTILLKKPDLSMTLNGCLAGLVGITAGADCVSITSSIIIGGIAGCIVVPAVLLFDKLYLDDPVGALSVHLVCGVWGTLAVGIFGCDVFNTGATYSFWVQAFGALVTFVAAFPSAFIIFYVLKKTMGIRVHEDEELKGLDMSEHGMEAYHGFQFFTNQ